MLRPLAALAVTIALLAGCGGSDDGDDLVSEDSLLDCLSEGGLAAEPAGGTPNPGLGNVSADFSLVTAEGVAVDVVVQGNEEKTRRSAADISAALTTLGAAGAEVVSERNAIVVFDGDPSDDARAAAEDCLGE